MVNRHTVNRFCNWLNLVVLASGDNSGGWTLAECNYNWTFHLETALSLEICKSLYQLHYAFRQVSVFVFVFFLGLNGFYFLGSSTIPEVNFTVYLNFVLFHSSTDMCKSCKKWWDESTHYIWVGVVWTLGYICTLLW